MPALNPADWVRVSDSVTGHHYTVPRSAFEGAKHLNELKQDPLTPNGRLRPPKLKRPSVLTDGSKAPEPKSGGSTTEAEGATS